MLSKEKNMEKALRIIDDLLDRIGMLFLVLLFVVTVVQVFCRYVLNYPLPWPEEIACYLFIWVTYIGLVKNVRDDDHFRIDFVQLMLSPANRARVAIAFYCLMLWFLLSAGWGSLPLLRSSGHILSANSISVNVIYAALPAMSVFIILHLVVLIGKKIAFLRGGAPLREKTEGRE